MVDPMTGAIAAGIAGKAIDEVISIIQESDNPERSWRRSGFEIAVQLQATFKVQSTGSVSWDEVQEEVRSYGEMAQELVLRGQTYGFDPAFREDLENLATACIEFAEIFVTGTTSLPEEYEAMIAPHIDAIINRADVTPEGA